MKVKEQTLYVTKMGSYYAEKIDDLIPVSTTIID